jgi:2-polyprenyl-3-methyl-5-hydroxy-6-metoxy-1,4-benzoquinol methylase
MGIGTAIRRSFGPLEPFVAETYRRRFINLDDFARTVSSITVGSRILEVGCGDGAVANRICREFPEAHYLGIDIAPSPGRLFAGDRQRAEFRTESSSQLLASHPEPFDLVMLVDVFHHLPGPARLATLGDLDALCSSDGLIIIKDWERSLTPAHLACSVSDRYISGDRDAMYATRSELIDAIMVGIPGGGLVCETRIPPRRNNIMFAVRRSAPLSGRNRV